jgi:hypothetical protein
MFAVFVGLIISELANNCQALFLAFLQKKYDKYT